MVRLIYAALVTDVVDGIPSALGAPNPCLLTLANRSPQRVQSGRLMAATSVGLGGVSAGATALPVASAAGILPGYTLWVGGSSPEAVVVAPAGPAGPSVPLVAPLASSHLAGALVSTLPTIVTQEEPRVSLSAQSDYWRIVLGPWHEFPDRALLQRAPTRLYTALGFVKVYDSSPSRKLAEDVMDRLDLLLNLGEAGCNGNPTPLLGTSTRIWVDSLKLGESPEPRYESATQVTQFPMSLVAAYTKAYT